MSTFRNFAVELQTMIASYMSPYDLAQFAQTSRLSLAISKRPKLYTDALLRMGFSIPMPSMSVYEFCIGFFGGGLCSACGNHTDAIPLSYTLRLRVCNRVCQDALVANKIIVEIATRKNPTAQREELERLKTWLPRVEPLIRGHTFYLRSDILRASSQLQQAKSRDKFQADGQGCPVEDREVTLRKSWEEKALELPEKMKVARDVLRWQEMVYLEERDTLKRNVSKHLSRILKMRELDCTTAEILRSPTLQRAIKLWNRDLLEITLPAFAAIQPVVLREAFLAQAGVPPPLFEYRKSDKILCPVCSSGNPFLVDNLVTHIFHKHPDDFPRLRDTYNTTPKLKYCELCPPSMRKYNMQGMRDHVAARHTQK
ncbi:hypothetical protein R3P38DRAFT_2860288 [Favolaschia claudopus]|uniref:F-box domain-containing protein n=1 Tax=Favolaschia claudopus TaxID=2862362 RepID=A0AAW0DML2_9AGAR